MPQEESVYCLPEGLSNHVQRTLEIRLDFQVAILHGGQRFSRHVRWQAVSAAAIRHGAVHKGTQGEAGRGPGQARGTSLAALCLSTSACSPRSEADPRRRLSFSSKH